MATFMAVMVADAICGGSIYMAMAPTHSDRQEKYYCPFINSSVSTEEGKKNNSNQHKYL
jgi:hypothetical protein